MATAVYEITPQDGWVQVTSGSTKLVKIRQYPLTHPILITSGSSDPVLNGSNASGTITFADQVAEDDTVTIGTTTFTFTATPTEDTDVEIGTDAEGSLDNLLAAISSQASGVVVANKTSPAVITLNAVATGSDGNDVVLTTTATNLTVSGSGTLSGGADATQGYRSDCWEFWSDVETSDNFYVRVITPAADSPLQVHVFTLS